MTSTTRWMPSSAAFLGDGKPLVILGDFNILPERLHSPELTNFFATFDLTLTPSPPTHRAGNQLDLIFTRSCGTSALAVTPLPVSDHHFVDFSLPLNSSPPSSLVPTLSPLAVTSNPSLPLRLPLLFCLHYPLSNDSLNYLQMNLQTLCYPPSPPPWIPSVPSTPDQRDPHRPCLGCPILCGLVEQSCEQLRGNGRDQTVLMIYLTIFSFFQISPLVCQQPNLPSNGPKSTTPPQTPGNCFPCSRPSSTLPHPHLLPASLLMTLLPTLPRK